MLRRVWDWLTKPAPVEQPKAWAWFHVNEYSSNGGRKVYSGRWVKVVSVREPVTDPRVPEETIGPFRSEVDCDEFLRSLKDKAQQEPKEPWQE